MSKGKQPTRQARERVADAFDPLSLIDICERDDFTEFADYYELAPSQYGDRFYYFQDNGSDILAVAHLDTVQEDRTCTITPTAAGLLACSGGLDDRLGAYVILEMLPRLGVNCDILLTTDEEMARSTGIEFVPTKSYNWMIQFDRGGTDVVMYQYETDELVDLVENCGAHVGVGSYSDIADLDHLGCAGFNWGVGYQDYHSPRSHAWLDDTFRMVARFVKFYHQNADKYLSYDLRSQNTSMYGLLKVDCGHWVDIDDPTSYDEDGHTVICAECAEELWYTDKVG